MNDKFVPESDSRYGDLYWGDSVIDWKKRWKERVKRT